MGGIHDRGDVVAAGELADADTDHDEANQGRSHRRDWPAYHRAKRDTERQGKEGRGWDHRRLLIEDVPAVDLGSLNIEQHNFQVADQRRRRQQWNKDYDQLREQPAHSRHALRPSEVLGAVLYLPRDERRTDEGTGQRREHDQAVLEKVEPHDGLRDLPEDVIGQTEAVSNGYRAVRGRKPELVGGVGGKPPDQSRQHECPQRLNPMLSPDDPGHDAASSSSGLGSVPAWGAER